MLRVFNDVVFPDFNEGDIEVTKYSELARVLSRSPELSRAKGVDNDPECIPVAEARVKAMAEKLPFSP